MGFFSWLLCSILVVALVLLLFPFSVRIEFEAGERGARALFFFFKKKVYEFEKKWGKGESAPAADEKHQSVILSETKDPVKSESMDSKDVAKPALVSEPISTESTSKSETLDPIEAEPLQGDKNESHLERILEPKAKGEVERSSAVADEPAAESVLEESKKEKPKKEKRKLSDREFWTILLTPDLDARAFRYVLKILGAVFSLFCIRFKDCFVEGIQTDYKTMGYLAATNGFLKAFPYVGDWDLRMDWAREKELHAAGTVRLSITLLRVFCFVLETLVLAGILGISFWRRRARVIKTNELPELGFVRRKILGFILED